MGQERLTLDYLQEFDPQHTGTVEVSFLCPVCSGEHKPRRTLDVNPELGVYICHRCGLRGLLGGYARPDKLSLEEIELRRVRLEENNARKQAVLQEQLGRCFPLVEHTAGWDYLLSRGLQLHPFLNDLKESEDFFGRAGVVFPIRENTKWAVVGLQCRYYDDVQPKVRTVGFVKKGVFWGQLSNGRKMLPDKEFGCDVSICEAPIDALSLEQLGQPAIATCGGRLADSFVEYVKITCQRNPITIYLASDADAPGDKISENWNRILTAAGAKCIRRKPKAGKDWNQYLLIKQGKGK